MVAVEGKNLGREFTRFSVYLLSAFQKCSIYRAFTLCPGMPAPVIASFIRCSLLQALFPGVLLLGITGSTYVTDI